MYLEKKIKIYEHTSEVATVAMQLVLTAKELPSVTLETIQSQNKTW